MLRIKLTPEGKARLAIAKAPPPAINPQKGAKVSVKQVAEILRIDPAIVREFFVNTPTHKKYTAIRTNEYTQLSMKNHQIYFDEEHLMIWFDMNYVGMSALYWSRKAEWLRKEEE